MHTELDKQARITRRAKSDPRLAAILGGHDPFDDLPAEDDGVQDSDGGILGFSATSTKVKAALEAKREELRLLAQAAEGVVGAGAGTGSARRPSGVRSEFDSADERDSAAEDDDDDGPPGVNDTVFPELGVRIAGPPRGHEGVPGPFLDLVKRPGIGLKPSGQVRHRRGGLGHCSVLLSVHLCVRGYVCALVSQL